MFTENSPKFPNSGTGCGYILTEQDAGGNLTKTATNGIAYKIPVRVYFYG